MKVAKFKLYDGRDPREIPAYLLNEAAHYTGVPIATLRDWIKGGVNRTSSGETYVLGVLSKRYTFTEPNRVISLIEDLTDEDFVSEGK